VPRLFDRALARRRLQRAAAAPVDFLMAAAAEDLALRLQPIQRDFGQMLDAGSPLPHFAAVVSERWPGAGLLRMAPVAGSPAALVGDVEALPFGAAAFDLIVSGMALHGVNDLPGALWQARQSLRPDGLFIACLPGGQTLRELRDVLTRAEAEVTGGASPRVSPFVDVRDLGQLLQRAGFALPVTDSELLTVRYADMFGLLRDLRGMGATSTLAERLTRPTRRGVFLRAAELYARDHADADGRVRASFELVWALGWAPHASQQQPLRPGSARRRLADALGTLELPAGDKAGANRP
jgi:SAM-dependent methyltransferase